MKIWTSFCYQKKRFGSEEIYRYVFFSRSQITRLYYHVQQNNQTVEPWEDKVQPAKFHEDLAKLLQNDSSLRDDFMMSGQAETKVYTLFIQGHQKDFSDIRTAIQRSWQISVTGKCLEDCEILDCMLNWELFVKWFI